MVVQEDVRDLVTKDGGDDARLRFELGAQLDEEVTLPGPAQLDATRFLEALHEGDDDRADRELVGGGDLPGEVLHADDRVVHREADVPFPRRCGGRWQLPLLDGRHQHAQRVADVTNVGKPARRHGAPQYSALVKSGHPADPGEARAFARRHGVRDLVLP